jgi:hypothetical protein
MYIKINENKYNFNKFVEFSIQFFSCILNDLFHQPGISFIEKLYLREIFFFF